jgi:hypothetical protein
MLPRLLREDTYSCHQGLVGRDRADGLSHQNYLLQARQMPPLIAYRVV